MAYLQSTIGRGGGTSTLLQLNPLETSLRRMGDGAFEVTRPAEPGPIPNYKGDMFTYKGATQTPWTSENTVSFTSPAEYQARILSGSLVDTGGCTGMAHVTHHIEERPRFPPGTVRTAVLTSSRYIPTCDPALDELHAVASSIVPLLEPLLDACRAYHTHTPSEGWITTGGFMTAARRAGLALSRAEFLSLERALTKDSFGRINFVQVEQLVLSVAGADADSAATQ